MLTTKSSDVRVAIQPFLALCAARFTARWWRLPAVLLVLNGFCLPAGRAVPSVTVTGQTPGVTPFISLVKMSVDKPDKFDSVTFKIKSKPGSVVRPIHARYSAAYLERRGYFNPQTGEITVPVFGLYSDYDNVVKVKTYFTNGRLQKDRINVVTAPYLLNSVHAQPEVILARTADTTLSYDYYLVKSYAEINTPLIFDTDGELRWAGASGAATQSVIFARKGIYAAFNTSILRLELDGTVTTLADYASQGVTNFHHNFDRGRDGIFLNVDTAADIETVNLEIDPVNGKILHAWDMGQIIRSAMIADGDDPSRFIRPGIDWFHTNCMTYRASDNTLLVSSRENFVIAVDYDTQEIKWLFGNLGKAWAQYPSLRKFALTLTPGGRAPIGQHAVSIVRDELLLFDNGYESVNQEYPGKGRAYSAGRKYRIDADALTATEVWNYKAGEAIYSSICSSIYEDQPGNFLLDYSSINSWTGMEMVGLNATGDKVFDYKYKVPYPCAGGWNATIIHLEDLNFNR